MSDYTCRTEIDAMAAQALANAASVAVALDGHEAVMDAAGADISQTGYHTICDWPVSMGIEVVAGTVEDPVERYYLTAGVYGFDAAPTHLSVAASVPNMVDIGNLPMLYNGTEKVSVLEAINMVAEAAGTGLSFDSRPAEIVM